MSKHALEVLFDSKIRLKILKFLFRNFDRRLTLADIIRHTQEDAGNVRREIARLKEINLINEEEKKEEKSKKA